MADNFHDNAIGYFYQLIKLDCPQRPSKPLIGADFVHLGDTSFENAAATQANKQPSRLPISATHGHQFGQPSHAEMKFT